jgi:hypothetical protein
MPALWFCAEEIANLKEIVFNGPFKDRDIPDSSASRKDEDVVKVHLRSRDHRRNAPKN